jgi:hypothetical protein
MVMVWRRSGPVKRRAAVMNVWRNILNLKKFELLQSTGHFWLAYLLLRNCCVTTIFEIVFMFPVYNDV